ncbi:MAG: hypothetical protein ACKV22_11900 [Bryobacteraceae bacterium]
MLKKVFLLVTVLAMTALASAKTYSITLFEPSHVAGTVLSPGDYKIDLKDNDKVTIRSGKTVVEAEARLETTDQKFSATSVRYLNGDGKYRIQEIRLGGTKSKLVFN